MSASNGAKVGGKDLQVTVTQENFLRLHIANSELFIKRIEKKLGEANQEAEDFLKYIQDQKKNTASSFNFSTFKKYVFDFDFWFLIVLD